MNKNDVIGYVLYDETDINHCVMLGTYRTLKEAAKAAKIHKENFPDSVIQAYEVIRE